MENSQNTVISNEVEVTGTIKSAGSLRIDGKLDGELVCQGDAIIGKTASIKGNISVNSVTVEGSVNGNMVAQDKIEMKASARVNGDIQSKRLAVEDGVTFIGKSEVNPGGAPVSGRAAPAASAGESGEKPPARPAASQGKK